MKSYLVLIIGRSGSGKTTLSKYALDNINDLRYMRTYTTRSPRENEKTMCDEYIFVDKEKYFYLREMSCKWDESVVHGNYYGVDIESIRNDMKNGFNFILNVYPDVKIINDISCKYDCDILKIFIDIDCNLSTIRIFKERQKHEFNRIEQEDLIDLNKVKQKCNIIFSPVGDIKQDGKRFCEIIDEYKINLQQTVKTKHGGVK